MSSTANARKFEPVLNLEHPHRESGGTTRYLWCCVEPMILDLMLHPPWTAADIARTLDEKFRFPRLNPIEFNADIPRDEPAPRPRRYRVKTLDGADRCHTCGERRPCPYVVPGDKRRADDAHHECRSCYRARG